MWAAIGVALSTTFSAILFFVATFSLYNEANLTHMTKGVPRRPNPYMYLDKILTNATREFEPIMNFPPVVLQLDEADPSSRMREEDRGRPTVFGTVYPDDRHVVVSDKVTPIL